MYINILYIYYILFDSILLYSILFYGLLLMSIAASRSPAVSSSMAGDVDMFRASVGTKGSPREVLHTYINNKK